MLEMPFWLKAAKPERFGTKHREPAARRECILPWDHNVDFHGEVQLLGKLLGPQTFALVSVLQLLAATKHCSPNDPSTLSVAGQKKGELHHHSTLLLLLLLLASSGIPCQLEQDPTTPVLGGKRFIGLRFHSP